MEATARGRNLRVSHKDLREIARYIQGDSVEKARARLQRVIAKEEAVPFKRHTEGAAHRSGNMTGGRYPVKAAKEVLRILESAEQNALHQDMQEDTLRVYRVISNKGRNQYKPSRRRGQTMKLSHLTLTIRGKGPAQPQPQSSKDDEVALETSQPEQEEPAAEEDVSEEGEPEESAPDVSAEDIVSGTISDAKDALEGFTGDLQDVLEAEKAGKNRVTLIEHIESLIEEDNQ